MHDSNFDVSVENHITFSASITCQRFGHGHHFHPEQIIVISCTAIILVMVTSDMINDLVGLSKSWLGASSQKALERHITVLAFQMT